MRLTEIEYGSLLAYSPHGTSREIQRSQQLMVAVKQDRYVSDSNREFHLVLMSEWIAQMIELSGQKLPFSHYFGRDVLLVPAPRSSLMRPGTLWVPERIATALAKRQLGKVAVCLKRVRAVPKSSLSLPGERPKPIDHFNSLEIQGTLESSSEIVIIDDVVSRGSTICGAANRLAEAFPDSEIRAFAAMRTLRENKFQGSLSPVTGRVVLRKDQGDTEREP